MTHAAVLVVEDDPSLREALCDTLTIAGYPVLATQDGKTACEIMKSESIGMVVSDVQMKHMDGFELLKKMKLSTPDIPVVLMTAYGTVQKAVEAMQEGAVDYLVKPFDAKLLVEKVRQFILTDEFAQDTDQGSDQNSGQDSELIAEDDESKKMMLLAKRVAESDATVLITGESGCGKEVYARFIHRHSSVGKGPFVAINCAAIPENMLEAELFGYDKGAFTGAIQSRAGKFEQANGGTLLLDEISEMDLSLQAKLLRVLQEREVERLGGKGVIKLNVRVLATSNRNLREEIAAGRFREDLFYRLNVFPLHLAPLVSRPRDIMPLVQRMIKSNLPERHAQIVISPEAQQKLQAHGWPGNVRELDNVIQRALILMAGNEIQDFDLCIEDSVDGSIQINPIQELPQTSAAEQLQTSESGQTETDRLGAGMKTHEQRLILDVLDAVKGSRKLAAERLGISPRTLRYKLARLRDAGIEVPA